MVSFRLRFRFRFGFVCGFGIDLLNIGFSFGFVLDMLLISDSLLVQVFVLIFTFCAHLKPNSIAIQFGKKLESKNANVAVTVHGVDVDDWKQTLDDKCTEYQSKRGDMGLHKTSPAIWEGTLVVLFISFFNSEGCGGEYEEFVGGYTEFLKYAQKQQHIQ
jgi:hypothetical protein